MKIEFEVLDITVLRTTGTDKIVVKFVGPPAYPTWLENEVPYFSIEVSKGHGVTYCKDVFNVEAKVLDTTCKQ